MPNNATPAQLLSGKTLERGWKVIRSVDQPEGATGGSFSASYIVRSDDGQEAFLKAMDYKRALEASEPARTLQAMTEAYNFERDILEKCRSQHLSRIIRVIDNGKIFADDRDTSSTVEYLIFELADGDIRSFNKFDKAFETAWALRAMHQTAAALRQLHAAGIAHQDVKPSNLLVFGENKSKLADLGRASDRHTGSPFDSEACAGDLTYAPPELLYGAPPQEWEERRLGCDMYLLGSMVVFFCAKVSMTHMLLCKIDENHHPRKWNGTYSDVLPYLQKEFTEVLRELRKTIQEDYAEDIANVVEQLCNLDPKKRGHPKSHIQRGSQYSLERYVSIFDRLAKKAEYSLTRELPLQQTQ